MSHFVKSSKGELMFAAFALPRGLKSRLEPERIKLSHFVLSSRSEWLMKFFNFLMFQKVTLATEDADKVGKRQVPEDCYSHVMI